MAKKEEVKVHETPKVIDKPKKAKLSPEEVESRYQEHLKRLGGK